jgi:hypothetical protein
MITLIVSTEFNSREYAKQHLKLLRDKLEEIYDRELQLVNYYELAKKFQDD